MWYKYELKKVELATILADRKKGEKKKRGRKIKIDGPTEGYATKCYGILTGNKFGNNDYSAVNRTNNRSTELEHLISHLKREQAEELSAIIDKFLPDNLKKPFLDCMNKIEQKRDAPRSENVVKALTVHFSRIWSLGKYRE